VPLLRYSCEAQHFFLALRDLLGKNVRFRFEYINRALKERI